MKAKAREFAIKYHGCQKYGHFPYSYHLDKVASICRPYGELAETIAFLHDVLEDTLATQELISLEFNSFIAQCVQAIADEPGSSRKEIKAKTYKKLSSIEQAFDIALIVKAGDRLANLQACLETGNNKLLAMYKSEHALFTKSVYRAELCEPIWDEIQAIISG